MKKFFTLFAIAAILATGCASSSKLKEENEKLKSDLSSAVQREGELQRKLKEQEDRYERDCKTVSNGFMDEISDGDFSMRKVKGGLAVNLTDRLFFETGKADVKVTGQAVLRRLAENLKKMPDKVIRVDGHTDSSPIRAGSELSMKYRTNWELGAARAINVTRYLTEKCGIDPQTISAATYSMYQPVESNSTKKGKAKNRRIEVIIMDRQVSEYLKPDKE